MNNLIEPLEERRIARVGFRSLMRAILRHRLSVIGIVIILIIAGLAVFAPWLAPFDPNKQDLYEVLKGPSAKHWLGTDNVGRDLLSRVIYGSRVSMYVGLIATAFAACIGILIGLIAGYRGGLIDNILMRITDTFMCFPFLIFVLAMAAALGPGINNIIISISLLGWTGFARIIRGQVLMVRELPYIEAARAVGVSRYGIMFRHVLPNSLAPVIVAASITVGAAIMTEASTAFLGLGVEPPTASWGKELRVGYTYLDRFPLFSIAPGLMVSLAVLAFNFLGDGLRDALDPRLRGEEQK